jgi:hypothetical protein
MQNIAMKYTNKIIDLKSSLFKNLSKLGETEIYNEIISLIRDVQIFSQNLTIPEPDRERIVSLHLH